MRQNDPFDDDDDDPFEDIFREVERMLDEMMGEMPHENPFAAPGGSDPSTATDAHIDIQETENEIRIVADISGVTKETITLRCDSRVLRIDAAGDRREYDERIRLPQRVDPDSAEVSCNNGILDMAFDRADNTADIGIA